MATFRRFEDIEAWQFGRELTRVFCNHSKEGEFANDLPLRDTVQSLCLSVTAHIAEGFDRGENQQFLACLANAKVACAQIRSLLYTVSDLSYLTVQQSEDVRKLVDRTSASLASLMLQVERSGAHANPFVNTTAKRGIRPEG
jgi:four helix bundle protein